MSRVLSLTDEQRDQIARESLDHGQLLDSAFAAGVEAATAAIIADIQAHRADAKGVEANLQVIQLRQDQMTAFIRGLDAAVLVVRGQQP